MMYWKPYVMDHMERNGGIIRARELEELGFSRLCLRELLEQGAIRRIERGIYVRIDYEEDEVLVVQKKYPQMTYSHDTALCLNKRIWCHYNNLTVTVPSGYKVSKKVEMICSVFYVKKSLYDVGRIKVASATGIKVYAYNAERSICDLVRSRRSFPRWYIERRLVELFGAESSDGWPAGIDRDQLWSYASLFGVGVFLKQWFRGHNIEYKGA